MKVVEFNARFGDPEAQTYMRLLDGDLYEILDSCTRGELDTQRRHWKPGVAISVAAVSTATRHLQEGPADIRNRQSLLEPESSSSTAERFRPRRPQDCGRPRSVRHRGGV